MANVKISQFWKKLENALSQLEKSTQIWLLEKFLNEANNSIKAAKVLIKEPEIVSLKTAQTIKDTKRKSKKKVIKKKVEYNKSKPVIYENKIQDFTPDLQSKYVNEKEDDRTVKVDTLKRVAGKTESMTGNQTSMEPINIENQQIPKINVQNIFSKKSPPIKEDESKKTESINIDSLLSAYKEEASTSEKQDEVGTLSEDEERENIAPLKVDQWQDMFKKEKKVQSVTIKSKHQQAREDKTSKILLPVLQILNSGNKKWGGVNLSMKKILSSKKTEMQRRRASEPVFWDKIEKPEEEDESSTFTGLKSEDINGPCINTKDDAMKKLGIEKRFIGHSSAGVSIKVPLSTYSEKDIIEAFRKKLEGSASKSSNQVILHESYQVVRRVMNAKNKYRGIGLGAVKREKFANLLTNMTKEAEENTKKKEISEQARINPANFKLKKAIDHNKGRVKLAIALNSSHNSWKQKHGITEEMQPRGKRETAQQIENREPSRNRTSKPEEKETNLDEEQRKMIASFKFRQIVDSKRGGIRVANILHNSTMMSRKFGSRPAEMK